MKTVGVKFTQVRHHLSIFNKKGLSSRSPPQKKIYIREIGGAHLQCVSNHCVKFKYKDMNSLGVTEYTN